MTSFALRELEAVAAAWRWAGLAAVVRLLGCDPDDGVRAVGRACDAGLLTREDIGHVGGRDVSTPTTVSVLGGEERIVLALLAHRDDATQPWLEAAAGVSPLGSHRPHLDRLHARGLVARRIRNGRWVWWLTGPGRTQTRLQGVPAGIDVDEMLRRGHRRGWAAA